MLSYAEITSQDGECPHPVVHIRHDHRTLEQPRDIVYAGHHANVKAALADQVDVHQCTFGFGKRIVDHPFHCRQSGHRGVTHPNDPATAVGDLLYGADIIDDAGVALIVGICFFVNI